MDIPTGKLGGGNSLTKVPSSQEILDCLKVKKDKQHRKEEEKKRQEEARKEGEDRKEKKGSYVYISLVMDRRPNEQRLCWIPSPH